MKPTVAQTDERKRKGMTIVEVAIVCVILLVLIAIVVPNFLEGVSSKISLPKNGMRALATALEAYFVAYKTYPGMRPLRDFGNHDKRLKKAGGWSLMAVDPGDGEHQGLTTPVAYMDRLPSDTLSPKKAYPFAYYTDGPGWILVSPGRDGDYDLDPAKDYTSSKAQPSDHLFTHGTYEVTNGTESDGDIWRVKQ